MNRMSLKLRIGFTLVAALACMSTLALAVLPMISAGALA
jgi:hypothetical protein